MYNNPFVKCFLQNKCRFKDGRTKSGYYEDNDQEGKVVIKVEARILFHWMYN